MKKVFFSLFSVVKYDNRVIMIDKNAKMFLHLFVVFLKIKELYGAGTTIVPIQLTAFSGIISSQINTASSSYEWIITPSNPTATSIQLVFSSLSLPSAQISIFDTAALNSAPLYTCNICTTTQQMPPSFFSRTGSVTITAGGIAGATFMTSSFSLQYISQVTVKTPALLNITIVLNSGYGSIIPQLLNTNLVANSVQQWKITQPSLTPISFSFSNFKFSTTTCSARLKIYDSFSGGNLLYSGCVQSDFPITWIYSNTGKGLVVLTGGVNDQLIDFQITFDSNANLYLCGSFLLPDALIDRSMILSDGSLITSNMRQSQSCTFLISPETSSTITLFFQFINLKIGSSVIVYDNNIASGTILYNGLITRATSSNQIITPPPITSSGSALYVTYTSNSLPSSTSTGFRAQYQSNYLGSLGVGSGQTFLSMSSAIDILPPGDFLCIRLHVKPYTIIL